MTILEKEIRITLLLLVKVIFLMGITIAIFYGVYTALIYIFPYKMYVKELNAFVVSSVIACTFFHFIAGVLCKNSFNINCASTLKKTYNDSDDVPKLGSYGPIGISMFGSYGRNENKFVRGYEFFFFVIPLLPIGCHIYKILSEEQTSYGVQETIKTRYSFYGKSKWYILEIFDVYIKWISIISVIIDIIAWIYFFIEK